MRRLTRWIVGALPLDDRGRRAMNETLADWEHESARATGAAARAAATALALLAVARAFLLLTVRETWRIPTGWVLGRFVPLVVISSLAVTMNTTARLVAASLWQGHPSLLGWLALMAAPMALPFACLVAIATTPRRRLLPLLGLTAATIAASLLLNGWIGPDSSVHFRQSAYYFVTSTSIGHELTRGLPEMRPGDLVGLALAGGSRSRVAADMLLLRMSLVVACPLAVFLAARLRGMPWWMRGVAMGSFPVAFILGMRTPVGIGSAIVLAFLGSLALTWRVRDPREPSASTP
jgi:hypothetical protein